MTTIAMSLLLCAIAFVESSFNPLAYNEAEDAAGIMQIRMIMVRDVNRIIGKDTYSSDDRYNVEKSFEMARVYLEHYCNGYKAEDMARCWNQGHASWKRNPRITDEYWVKVKGKIKMMMRQAQ